MERRPDGAGEGARTNTVPNQAAIAETPPASQGARRAPWGGRMLDAEYLAQLSLGHRRRPDSDFPLVARTGFVAAAVACGGSGLGRACARCVPLSRQRRI